MHHVKPITALLAVLLLGQLAYRTLSERPRSLSVVLTMAGDSVPQVAIEPQGTTNGVTLTEFVAQGCTIIYFFDPDCGACGVSAPTWANRPKALSATFVWVSVTADLERSAAFLRQHRLTQRFAITETAFPSSLGIAGVPAIWGVQNGIVRHIVSGSEGTSAENVTMEWCTL